METTIIVVASLGYILASYTIWKGASTSFWSWFAWGVMDLLVLIPSIEKGDNVTALGIYTVGSLAVAGIASIKRQFQWGWVEKSSLLLGVACFAATYFAQPNVAILFGAICLGLVGIPLLVEVTKSDVRTRMEQIVAGCFAICGVCSIILGIDTRSSLAFPLCSAIFGLLWLSLVTLKVK